MYKNFSAEQEEEGIGEGTGAPSPEEKGEKKLQSVR